MSKDGLIELSGIDKELLGDVAARIRKVRKPDSYAGKGIRYDGEVVQDQARQERFQRLRLNCKE